MTDNEITAIVGWPTEQGMEYFRAIATTVVCAERAARAETYTGGNPTGWPVSRYKSIYARLRAGEDCQAVMADYGIRFEAPAVEQKTPKSSITTYCGQALPPIGALLKIRWCDPSHDWPYFWLADVNIGQERIRLKGADYPDGSAKHDGDVFWALISEIDNIEVVVDDHE